MRISSLISFVGFVLVIAGAYCPLIKFTLLREDLFDLNRPYGMTVLLMAVVGILAVALDRRALIKIAAYVTSVLIVLLFVGAYAQAKAEFNFIPFKFFSRILTAAIKFKWGWYVLFAGGILSVAGTLASKPRSIKHTK